jgi:4-aminobutyrate aminotransferase-like enzyme
LPNSPSACWKWQGFDRVFLVNSGTEANDLAIRLAWAYSGGRDLLSVLEAYHGWSVATDAISTSIADNPQALETRPDWVHPVEAPNTFRGRFRGADSAADYLRDVDAKLADLDARGRQLAGMICEPVYGNAGGISLPAGYLREAYAKVRRRRVCIADEVQVAMGAWANISGASRSRAWCRTSSPWPRAWATASRWGGDHPPRDRRGAGAEGYFFSSAGGSPVSCRIGMAVLDVMRTKGCGTTPVTWGGISRRGCRRLSISIRWRVPPMVRASTWGWSWCATGTLEPATEDHAPVQPPAWLGIFMQPTGDYLNILKIKPPMCTTRASVDYFVDSVERMLAEGL